MTQLCEVIQHSLNVDALLREFKTIVEPHQIFFDSWQLCVHRRKETTGLEQYTEGGQSLVWDWDNVDEDGNPTKKNPIHKENEFQTITEIFKGTYIEEVSNWLNKDYNAVRGRFMQLKPKSCLSTHKDPSLRLHIPIITNEDCFMMFKEQDIVIKMHNTSDMYIVDTTKSHTAVNASKLERTHLVYCLTH